jgi:hypothetical protein
VAELIIDVRLKLVSWEFRECLLATLSKVSNVYVTIGDKLCFRFIRIMYDVFLFKNS